MYRLAKITGWGFREIMEELPFSAGLQLLHADAWAHGQKKYWARNNTAAVFDSVAELDAAIEKIKNG